ncbi:hypothetical protein TESG_06975 [Trichophyton tonsurans CBS 112818]|uniref:Uncharacterized protein n=1 Tax=Trichophyton tonsurans (strain CBS 112818) TaxID=647933 RepID=F2S7T1_TRIT1|nr:hypothetical protein TESG_06975 [Trichophyton tonsurans CBS 112818]
MGPLDIYSAAAPDTTDECLCRLGHSTAGDARTAHGLTKVDRRLHPRTVRQPASQRTSRLHQAVAWTSSFRPGRRHPTIFFLREPWFGRSALISVAASHQPKEAKGLLQRQTASHHIKHKTLLYWPVAASSRCSRSPPLIHTNQACSWLHLS